MNLPDGFYLKNRKYQLTNTIGQGGFGITYLGVWNTVVKGELGAMRTKVPVCIKEYFFKDYCYRESDTQAVKVHSQTGEKLFDKFKEKLITEAKILSDVHYPYIVNVLEVFEENNTAYIVMEYIRGCSLKYMLDKTGVLPENKVLKYTHQIGNALDFVHNKSIVHLDIKPSNILIDREDNARLIDFGVSKRYDIDDRAASTTTLTVSKGFASIEQYDDEGMQNFSPCPDIYSLGATMYNLLTGMIPIESILRANKQMPDPSKLNSNLSRRTEQAILKAMEIKPEDRYSSIREMLASLDVPPYELAENTLVESGDNTDDETTEGLTGSTSSRLHESIEDEDNTVLNHKNTKRKRRNKYRSSSYNRRRNILQIVAIMLIIIFGFTVYDYFFGGNKMIDTLISVIQTKDTIPSVIIKPDTASLATTTTKEQITTPIPAAQTTTPTQSQTQTQTQTNTPQGQQNQAGIKDKPESRTTTNTKPADTKTPETGNQAQAIDQAAETEKEYQRLISSGKANMGKKNYADAKTDFTKAKDLNPSKNEATDLLELCEEKILSEINERIAKYEKCERCGTLGAGLTIVRNRATKLYGAINSKGLEHIPCKYLMVDRTPMGKAFMRNDKKYDVYNDKGVLVSEGIEDVE